MKTSIFTVLLILASIVFAGQIPSKNPNKRIPSGENFTPVNGTVTVNLTPNTVSPVMIYGEAAKAMYDAMTAVPVTQKGKGGKNVSCYVESGAGSTASFRCDMYLQVDGGFVN